MLDHALSNRYSVIATGIGILAIALATGYWGIGSAKMNFSFFPPIESDYVTASLVMPQGTPVEATERAARMLLDSAHRTQAQMDEEGLEVEPGELVVAFQARARMFADSIRIVPTVAVDEQEQRSTVVTGKVARE